MKTALDLENLEETFKALENTQDTLKETVKKLCEKLNPDEREALWLKALPYTPLGKAVIQSKNKYQEIERLKEKSISLLTNATMDAYQKTKGILETVVDTNSHIMQAICFAEDNRRISSNCYQLPLS